MADEDLDAYIRRVDGRALDRLAAVLDVEAALRRVLAEVDRRNGPEPSALMTQGE